MPIKAISPSLVTKFYVNRYLFTYRADKSHPIRKPDLKALNLLFITYKQCIQRIVSKMGKKGSTSSSTYVWNGYININIPSDKMEEATQYIRNQNEVHQDLITAFSQGLTVKMYFDDKSDSYKCVFTDHNPESENFGYALSSFGSDWFTALASGLFKHHVLADGVWSDFKEDYKRSFG